MTSFVSPYPGDTHNICAAAFSDIGLPIEPALVAAVVRILDNFHLLLTSFAYVDEIGTDLYRFFEMF